MYDRLYDSLPHFVRQTGFNVEIVAQLPHPELNAWVERSFGAGDPDIDFLSTHTKYAPSQAEWLTPLDDVVDGADLADLLARPADLSRVDGVLLQVPRNIDVQAAALPDGSDRSSARHMDRSRRRSGARGHRLAGRVSLSGA